MNQAAKYFNKMSINELTDKTFNSDDTVKVELLLGAINDWPDSIDSLDDFLEALKVDLKSNDLAYSIINKRSSKLDMATQAWKMESYSSLIELIKICNYRPLD